MKMSPFSMSDSKTFRYVTMLLFFLFFFVPMFTHANDNIESLKKVAKGFSSVSKKAVPAVVSIEVRSSAEGTSFPQRRSFEQEDPFNFFNDEFFRHFFGAPDHKRGPQRGYPRGKNPGSARGSGCIVSEDGYILTNNHVIGDGDSIVVIMSDGRELEAKLIGSDRGTDIAVIKVDAVNLPYLSFGDSNHLDVGEWVIAIGNPLGLEASVTVGIVSAKGRNNLNITDFGDLIQTDAAINPGSSGGCLLNLDGSLVGLNTAIASTSGGYMGIGFAIPSNILKHVMDQLVEKGAVTRGFLGVAPQDLDKELAASFNLEKAQGVLIADVVADSPAEKAGLQRGDIILKINDVFVHGSVEVSKEIGLMAPGSQANLLVYRKGKELQIAVDIGIHPGSLFHSEGAASKFGMEVQALTPELAEQFSYHNEKGVIVTSVEPRSPASRAGIRKGSLILAVDRKEITNLAEYFDAVKEAVKDQRVLLLVKQGRAMRFISLKIE